ncbi:glycosyltransferase family 9 protein [Spirosoma sp.]|uniref:glycosyltransferase family 9 protein n=1 Tax=Spirosoma sp. TaxID=1899569 RepID=UPI002616E510|nr:glycosyltransferase family 9 protein [Spirosoma sp.]MCX6215578.1 glycosyltransferase family 9 protein [Spirosoma sp.]
MKQLLLLRFSAMGDVALLAPVVQSFSQRYPDATITLVTRAKFAVFFEQLPGVRIIGADFEGRHKGLSGLLQLVKELRQIASFDVVIDAHQNLRSAVLKRLFQLTGVPSFTINKGRAEKNALTRKTNKIRRQLTHSVDRYARVFKTAGFDLDPIKPFTFPPIPAAEKELAAFLRNPSVRTDTPWLGIAPFAQHTQKMWPFDYVATLLPQLYDQQPITIFLFGGGPDEITRLKDLQQQFPQAVLVAGQLSMAAELLLISRLTGMVCMDSGNMHLAALSGVPVVSIWGSTHPDAGFGPWGQGEEAVVQISPDVLPCRPCSVFGNRPCFRGDLACLNWITVDMVANRVQQLLERSRSTSTN